MIVQSHQIWFRGEQVILRCKLVTPKYHTLPDDSMPNHLMIRIGPPILAVDQGQLRPEFWSILKNVFSEGEAVRNRNIARGTCKNIVTSRHCHVETNRIYQTSLSSGFSSRTVYKVHTESAFSACFFGISHAFVEHTPTHKIS